MIYEKFNKLPDNRIVASLIGMNKAKFDALVKPFENAAQTLQKERVARKEIKQVRHGGAEGHLDTYEKKLFFILYYLKTYPTFDVLGFHFGLSGGHAHTHVNQFLEILQRALSDLNVLPERAAAPPAEFNKLIEKYNDIAIDGMECACVRPQEDEEQERRYSGKKKTYAEDVGRI